MTKVIELSALDSSILVMIAGRGKLEKKLLIRLSKPAKLIAYEMVGKRTGDANAKKAAEAIICWSKANTKAFQERMKRREAYKYV